MFNLQKWLKDTAYSTIACRKRPVITCMDGTVLAVRASDIHFCKPRMSLLSGKYECVEVRDMSFTKDKMFQPYTMDDQFCVYSCVPVAIVEKIIEKHGGYQAC